ncbi:unnamed protein product [Angiostrongylus costaricensis]|uniref:Uncharacterized protein n=1 Tax=Angiostrongylus costaricensis TaxID=334426 RepID=A0A0R3PKN0_ANGCS|nr:unnamed protein product [Angiostrongylus costaricensis]
MLDEVNFSSEKMVPDRLWVSSSRTTELKRRPEASLSPGRPVPVCSSPLDAFIVCFAKTTMLVVLEVELHFSCSRTRVLLCWGTEIGWQCRP